MFGGQRTNERRIIVQHSNDGRSGARLHLIRTDELQTTSPSGATSIARPPRESV